MAKQQEILLREWDLGKGSNITLADLKEALQDIIDAAGMSILSVHEASNRNIPAIAIYGASQYMPVYHYLNGNSVMVSVVGKGEQIRAEDLEKFYSKAAGAWYKYQYAKNTGRSFAMRFGASGTAAGISAGITAATTMALKGGFKLAAKGVRALMRDQAAWEREMAFYQNALGVGDYVIGGADSNNIIAKIRAKAEENEPISQYALGMAYAEGRAVEASEETSLQWFAKAAANGELRSQGIIAQEYLYSEKEYGAEYKNTALQYLNNLAGSGYAWAIDSLLDIYAKGAVEGIPADYEQAATIAQACAEQGHVYSQMILAQICDQSLTNDAVISKYRDEGRAAALYKAVADAKEPSEYKAEAAYRLAQMYKRGSGVTKSNENAINYFEYSASLGNLDAKKLLTEAYTFGGVAEPDAAKAKRYAEELIRSNDDRYKPAAYYCKYKIADGAAEYKESIAAAKVYVSLAGADPQKVSELSGYIKYQEEKLAGMSEDDRRAYLKEPPKKKWIKYALIGGGVLLAIIIIVAIVSGMNNEDEYSDYDDSGYSDEYYDEDYADDSYSYEDSYSEDSYDDNGYYGEDDYGSFRDEEPLSYYGSDIDSEEQAIEFADDYRFEVYGWRADSIELYCENVTEMGYIIKSVADDVNDEGDLLSLVVTHDGYLYNYEE